MSADPSDLRPDPTDPSGGHHPDVGCMVVLLGLFALIGWIAYLNHVCK